MDAAVLGNVTLDIICQTVEDVPRYESISFEKATISPGGCGSNTAIGLCGLGVATGLIACIGDDLSSGIVTSVWEQVGLDTRFVRRAAGRTVGVSVGLVDAKAQPRFVHTPGANALWSLDELDLARLKAEGVRHFHVAGFFVLPGLLDGRLPDALHQAQQLGMTTTLDVVHKPFMSLEKLRPCFPYLNVFLCNEREGERLTGLTRGEQIAKMLREAGAASVIVKLGGEGCWLECASFSGRIAAGKAEVVDTTGAGDAFAAGLIAALLDGKSLAEACMAGNAAGGRAVSAAGAIGCWLP
ncbi:MAG: carbohydrate kinase family protein [Chloroflexi bacterium]|nr:carbohydrate kinase family protein [Chloroflexota bacterium]